MLKECIRLKPDDATIPLLAAKLCMGSLHWVSRAEAPRSPAGLPASFTSKHWTRTVASSSSATQKQGLSEPRTPEPLRPHPPTPGLRRIMFPGCSGAFLFTGVCFRGRVDKRELDLVFTQTLLYARKGRGTERCMSPSDSLPAERGFSVKARSHSVLQLTCKPALFAPPPSHRLSCSGPPVHMGIWEETRL